MNEIIFLVEESVESGFEAKSLGHSIFTEAETIPKLKEMIFDLIKCHLGTEKEFKIVQ